MSSVATAAAAKATRLVLMGFDVDGVLTDGTLYFELHMGVEDKRRLLAELAARRGIDLAQTGYMGDDVVDLPILRAQGKWNAAMAEYLA